MLKEPQMYGRSTKGHNTARQKQKQFFLMMQKHLRYPATYLPHFLQNQL